MYTQEITVQNEVGLHARPATYFIQKANEFKSGIWVEKEERRVNAKSLLGVLSLGIVKGTNIALIADGSDEKEAVDALVSLIQNNFGCQQAPALFCFYPLGGQAQARLTACPSGAFFLAHRWYDLCTKGRPRRGRRRPFHVFRCPLWGRPVSSRSRSRCYSGCCRSRSRCRPRTGTG